MDGFGLFTLNRRRFGAGSATCGDTGSTLSVRGGEAIEATGLTFMALRQGSAHKMPGPRKAPHVQSILRKHDINTFHWECFETGRERMGRRGREGRVGEGRGEEGRAGEERGGRREERWEGEQREVRRGKRRHRREGGREGARGEGGMEEGRTGESRAEERRGEHGMGRGEEGDRRGDETTCGEVR